MRKILASLLVFLLTSIVSFSAPSINPRDIKPGTVDATEFGYLDGVTNSIQTQLNFLSSNNTASVWVQANSNLIQSMYTRTSSWNQAVIDSASWTNWYQANSGSWVSVLSRTSTWDNAYSTSIIVSNWVVATSNLAQSAYDTSIFSSNNVVGLSNLVYALPTNNWNQSYIISQWSSNNTLGLSNLVYALPTNNWNIAYDTAIFSSNNMLTNLVVSYGTNNSYAKTNFIGYLAISTNYGSGGSGGTNTLQQVLDKGNQATNQIYLSFNGTTLEDIFNLYGLGINSNDQHFAVINTNDGMAGILGIGDMRGGSGVIGYGATGVCGEGEEGVLGVSTNVDGRGVSARSRLGPALYVDGWDSGLGIEVYNGNYKISGGVEVIDVSGNLVALTNWWATNTISAAIIATTNSPGFTNAVRAAQNASGGTNTLSEVLTKSNNMAGLGMTNGFADLLRLSLRTNVIITSGDGLNVGIEVLAAPVSAGGTQTYGTWMGYAALSGGVGGAGNSAFGFSALANSDSDTACAFGYSALINSTGNDNVAMGNSALNGITGSGNVGIGSAAGQGALPTTRLTAVGTAAAQNVGGTENTAIGFEAMKQTTGNNNTALGSGSGQQAPATNSVSIGVSAGSLSPGQENVAIGYVAHSTSAGSYNTAVGAGSLWLSPGSENAAFGLHSLYGTPGSYNTAFGNESSRESTGNWNTAIGYSAGYLSGGSANTFVGKSSGASAVYTVYSNATTLGADVKAKGTDTVAIGLPNQTTYIDGSLVVSNVFILNTTNIGEAVAAQGVAMMTNGGTYSSLSVTNLTSKGNFNVDNNQITNAANMQATTGMFNNIILNGTALSTNLTTMTNNATDGTYLYASVSGGVTNYSWQPLPQTSVPWPIVSAASSDVSQVWNYQKLTVTNSPCALYFQGVSVLGSNAGRTMWLTVDKGTNSFSFANANCTTVGVGCVTNLVATNSGVSDFMFVLPCAGTNLNVVWKGYSL